MTKQQSYPFIAPRIRTALLVVLGALSLNSFHNRAESAMKVVYLKKPNGGTSEARRSYQGRFPQEYISVKSNERELAKLPGADFVGIWAVYPEMQGMSPQNKAALLNERVPNTAVHIFLALAEPAVDWAKQKRDTALRQPADSTVAVQLHGERTQTGMTEYRYPNLPGNKRALFFENEEAGAVFVNCLFESMCDAVRSWKNVFAVRYQFDRTQIQDIQALDRSVIRLLKTFEITPAGN